MQQPEKQAVGFIRVLYDFSFSSFVTTKIIRALYVLITVVYTIAAIVLFIGFLAQGGVAIAIALIGVPIAYILYLALARVSLEVIAVVFRIAEYTRDIRDSLRLQTTVSPAAPPLTPPQDPSGSPASPPTPSV